MSMGGLVFRHVSIDYEITTPANTMLVAESGSGDLQLSNINGTVKAHTGSGSIRADKLGSGSRLETGSGTIEANNLMGSTTLQTGSGEIHAQLASAGDVVAGTGSGRYQTGQCTRSGEGGDRVGHTRDQRATHCTLEAGDGLGRYFAAAGQHAHFTLDAETGSGSVKSDPPLTMTTHGSTDKHHVSGTVNGGGPTIKAETGSGDIHIQ